MTETQTATEPQTVQPTDRGLVSETIAVLGAGGTMGFPIARNITRAGLPTRVWNRSRDKAAPLAADGAYLARTPRDAASGAGIVLTMLADEDAVISAMNGPEGALRALSGAHQANDAAADAPYGPHHGLWVQMSTIGEAATRRCAELANRSGVGFVDAPVLGTRRPAEEGKLVVLESGPQEARHRLAPVFDAIGQRTIRAGEAGAGSRLKTVVNCWVLAVVEAGAETLALAEALGVGPALFFNAADGGTLDLPYLRMKGKVMTMSDFTPDFRLALAAKDAGLGHRAAEERDLDLPLIEALARRYAEAAEEHGDKDFSATYLLSTRDCD